MEIQELRFNPTLVRLRPLRGYDDFPDFELFQSHAGSIEALTRFNAQRIFIFKFQSHAGSIEASSSTSPPRSRTPVSIPRWFD